MIERFQRSAQVVAPEHQLAFARRWIVAPRGIRPDALALAREHGVITSGRRQMERLERLVAGSFEAPWLARPEFHAEPKDELLRQ
jgi:hypothetical protein